MTNEETKKVSVMEVKIDKKHIYEAVQKAVKEIKQNFIGKIMAEILDEAEYAYADFDRYKEDILHAEPDELPDDDFRYGMERAVEIIDKYRAESEGVE